MKLMLILTMALLLVLNGVAMAQPTGDAAGGNAVARDGDAAPAGPADPDRPIFDVFGLIERLADEMDREFIVDTRINARMFGWSTAGEDADYDTLQALLRASGYIALESGDQIRILPEAVARAEPTKILQQNNRGISDHEIITRILKVSNIPVLPGSPLAESGSIAPQLVPALRPMMSTQAAQMQSIPGTTKLILVDRYDNVRRITAVIDELRR